MSTATRHAYPREATGARLVLQDVLGDTVHGLYLFGSAVVGGLRPDSDVDLLAVSRKELTVVTLSDVVPWRYPSQSEFIYGEWLRTSEHLTAGVRPDPDPDLALVLTTVAKL